MQDDVARIADGLTPEQRQSLIDEELDWWAVDLGLAEYDDAYDEETGDEYSWFTITELGQAVRQYLQENPK